MQASNVVPVPPTDSFVRTRTIWLSYAMNFYFGVHVSLLGPLMPFIGDKMDLNFTQMGYHFMLSSAGGLTISMVGDRIVRVLGGNRMSKLGALLSVTGLFGVLFGPSLAVTLPFVYLYGIGGGFIIYTTTISIANASQRHSTKAFTEAGIGGGTATIVGPATVGLVAASFLGWQAVAFFPLILAALIVFYFRRTALADAPETGKTVDAKNNDASRPLPLLFWVFGSMMLLSVAMEFLITSWSANFMTNVVGFSDSAAAGLVSVFTVAIVTGRLAGRRLLEVMPESRMLLLSLLWVLFTFPIFWLSTVQVLNVAGLFLVGLGIGNMSPLVQAGAMSAARHATSRASARLMIFPSLGNLVLLQTMGVLSDEIGIENAYAMMMVLAVVGIGIALASNRMRSAAVGM